MRPSLRSLMGPRGLLSCAAPPLGRCRWSEIGAAITAAGPGRAEAATAARTRAAEAAATTGPWPTKAAATAAEAAGSRAAEAAATAGPWPAKAAATAAEAAGTWRRAILTRACFAHRKAASLKRLCVEALDDFFGGRSLGVLDEGEAARSPGLAIDGHHDVRRLGYCGEVGAEIGFARPVGKVPDEQTDCQGSLLKCAALSDGRRFYPSLCQMLAKPGTRLRKERRHLGRWQRA